MHFNLEKNKTTLLIALNSLQLLVIIGLGYMVFKNEFKSVDLSQSQNKLRPITVETQFVSKGLFEKYITSLGTLKASETVKIASERGGVIKEVLFKNGQEVTKGDLLIKFEDDQYKARLNEALSKFKTAKSAYERSKALLERKIETKSKFEEAENAYRVTAATVEVARIDLERTEIRAPFNGYLGLREVSPGAYIKPGQEIVSLDKVSPIYVDFMVNESHVDVLAVGQEVEVEVDGFPQNDYKAIIDSIEPSADAIGHTIRVRAVLPNVTKELRPGFFAKVKVVESKDSSSVIVPESAIQNSGNVEFVYKVVDGVAKASPVIVSGRNGRVARVAKGLIPGQVIVTSGQQRIGDGVAVFVRPAVTIKKYR
jgi:membrane fusion protein (multidrug efflux system)